MASDILVPLEPSLNFANTIWVSQYLPKRDWTVITGCSMHLHKFKDLSVSQLNQHKVWIDLYLVILQW